MSHQDFSRPLHMLLGLPFDAVGMDDVVGMLRGLPGSGRRWFISTPNLNFLMAARSDPYFRQSVLDSDLSLADGMPIVWIARLLGIPLPERVPGSGLIEILRDSPQKDGVPLTVFFFGGEPGMARRAQETLNARPCGLKCVGAIDPGYGAIEDLSKPDHIARINAARPDFLIVALGAKKGQAWIMANRAALDVPMVSHLGAVIKFVAGEVERAPAAYQRFGLEWLWRIREEPGLWRRYAGDAAALLQLLLTRVLPLAIRNRRRRNAGGDAAAVRITDRDHAGRRRVVLSGCLDIENIATVRDTFRDIAAAKEPVDLDFAMVRHVDSAFLGQLHLLRACARAEGFDLRPVNMPRPIRQIFRWSLCEYLLVPAARG